MDFIRLIFDSQKFAAAKMAFSQVARAQIAYPTLPKVHNHDTQSFDIGDIAKTLAKQSVTKFKLAYPHFEHADAEIIRLNSDLQDAHAKLRSRDSRIRGIYRELCDTKMKLANTETELKSAQSVLETERVGFITEKNNAKQAINILHSSYEQVTSQLEAEKLIAENYAKDAEDLKRQLRNLVGRLNEETLKAKVLIEQKVKAEHVKFITEVKERIAKVEDIACRCQIKVNDDFEKEKKELIEQAAAKLKEKEEVYTREIKELKDRLENAKLLCNSTFDANKRLFQTSNDQIVEINKLKTQVANLTKQLEESKAASIKFQIDFSQAAEAEFVECFTELDKKIDEFAKINVSNQTALKNIEDLLTTSESEKNKALTAAANAESRRVAMEVETSQFTDTYVAKVNEFAAICQSVYTHSNRVVQDQQIQDAALRQEIVEVKQRNAELEAILASRSNDDLR
jgi:hypothetical protein